MAEYPPYVNAYNSIPKLFAGIQTAAVPSKVTQNFLESVLDLKSSSHRALIPLLKKLGFIDAGFLPTQAYKDFRDKTRSGSVMAEQIKTAYKPLFDANEYAWKLKKPELQEKIKNVVGAGDDDPYIPAVTNTFLELSKLATWDGAAPPKKEIVEAHVEEPMKAKNGFSGGFGISYTINLNLPATTEIEVFNAIFKSLRENLLRQS